MEITIVKWDSSYSQLLLDTPGNSTGYPWIIPAQYNTSLFTTQLESNATDINNKKRNLSHGIYSIPKIT